MTSADTPKARLTAALRLFEQAMEGNVVCMSGLAQLQVSLHVGQGSVTGADLERVQTANQNLLYVVEDVWDLGAVIAKLEWMHGLAVSGALQRDAWWSFGRTDIEHFFVILRSLLDHAASVIGQMSAKPKQLPSASFHDMLAFSQHPKKRSRLEPELAELFVSAPWFVDVKDARDAAVHRGARVLIFGSAPDGILFQILSGVGFAKVVPAEPYAAVNANGVLDFRRYAALLMADVLLFLDRVADAGFAHFPVARVGGMLTSTGFDVLREWMERYSV